MSQRVMITAQYRLIVHERAGRVGDAARGHAPGLLTVKQGVYL